MPVGPATRFPGRIRKLNWRFFKGFRIKSRVSQAIVCNLLDC